jgi:hypothetical protein
MVVTLFFLCVSLSLFCFHPINNTALILLDSLTLALIPYMFRFLGKGCYTYPDGRQFDGIYKDNEPDGNGTQTSSDGSVLHDGEWSMGEFLGS